MRDPTDGLEAIIEASRRTVTLLALASMPGCGDGKPYTDTSLNEATVTRGRHGQGVPVTEGGPSCSTRATPVGSFPEDRGDRARRTLHDQDLHGGQPGHVRGRAGQEVPRRRTAKRLRHRRVRREHDRFRRAGRGQESRHRLLEDAQEEEQAIEALARVAPGGGVGDVACESPGVDHGRRAMNNPGRPVSSVSPERRGSGRNVGRRWPGLPWFIIARRASVSSGRLARLAGAHPDPDRIWADAERAFLAGRWDRARSRSSHPREAGPKTGLDWMLEAQLATAEGRPDAALEAIGRIADDHPIAAQAQLLAGRIERQRGAHPESRGRLSPGARDQAGPDRGPQGTDLHPRHPVAPSRGQRRVPRPRPPHHAHSSRPVHLGLDPFHALESRHRRRTSTASSRPTPRTATADSRVVELILERPEAESYIEATLEPLPASDPDVRRSASTGPFSLGRLRRGRAPRPAGSFGHPRISRIRGELALRRHDLDAAIEHFREALSAEPYDRVSPDATRPGSPAQGRSRGRRSLRRTRQAAEPGL